ncbi:hypothetical protein AU210_002070 [Fusarium oxysporum f. sp. radicis-cucumerinum]|uniref:ER transporter 6TM N-terminal domain-containing protein n=4 Tax=Fusarium oxysporum TaxID=5507 RepID=A0A2H3IBE4_FUSOX|nr:hypothetical protein AU210_002070 [Fusarium oxysporum f. sp. radicis-cucumerinum]RKK27214.1 hypothetical protein BFJ66_g16759 [Fusarium oxysporum f. sp. cepae]RKK29772.1 hypothetical protein BFJ65_g1686 [Fusarium oxysporum f. sp. cepae]RKK39642.1 hypothetical protein BFJ67_g11393 [Fusarium oxysporum f. sp. cepae]
MFGPSQTAAADGNDLRDGSHQTSSAEETPQSVENPYFTNTGTTTLPRRKLPMWLDHFNARDLKMFFRCSVAMWIMTVFIYITPIQDEMGQASFLGCIVLWLAPPSGTIFINLIAAITVMLGVTTAWGWGLITMKAALATRSDAHTQSRLAELQRMAASQNATDPHIFAKVKILNGFMLDLNVTATYFCMICLYLYMIARLRVAAPKLRLTQMMGCIVSAVFLTQAPLLPSFNGNIARPLVLPCAIAEGIAMVCSIFIFPSSSASEALNIFQDLLAPMPTFLDACYLGLKYPSITMSTDRLTGVKLELLASYSRLKSISAFLPIDFSMGRWNGDDLINLTMPLQNLIIEFISLLEIHRQAEAHKERSEKALALVSMQAGQGNLETGRYQMNQEAEFHIRSKTSQHVEEAERNLRALSEPTKYLIDTCKESLTAINEALINASTFKQNSGYKSSLQRHVAVLENLREQIKVFNSFTSGYFSLSSFHIFNDDGIVQDEFGTVPGLTGLMMGLLIQERLCQLAGALSQLQSRVIELEKNRSSFRFWLPTRMASVLRWMCTTENSEGIPAADIDDSTIVRSPTTASAHYGLPVSLQTSPDAKSSRAELSSMRTPHNRRRGRASQSLLVVARWLGNAEGMFALRMVIMTIALSIPAVLSSSAGFYYRENGLWAVIMAQLTLLPYTADVVYGIIVRVTGTIVGGVVGMAAWYIGSGSGPGNPYGEAAAMALVILPFMWWRVFSSLPLMPAGVMMGITAYLVVIYSWIDMHNEPYGNPGKGYEIFWRRLTLVLIGLSGTFVTNFFPKPPSASRHYRHQLGKSLIGIRDQYALFVSNWEAPAQDLHAVAEEESLKAIGDLLSISGPVKLTVFEFSSSNFDTHALGRVCQLCMLIQQSVTQLLIYTTRLSDAQRQSVILSTEKTKENMVVEVMAVLTIVQQALKTDDPLPAMLPTPLFTREVVFTRRRIQKVLDNSEFNKDYTMDNEGLRKYVVLLNALLQMFAALDELVLVVKSAVGETSNIAILEV